MANVTNAQKEEVKKKLKIQQQKDAKLVKGRFIFNEVKGGTVTFSYKAYKGDPVNRYILTDGQEYTIPLGVANHLNNNCRYPIHEFLHDSNGKPTLQLKKMVNRMSFQSLTFEPIEDLSDPSSELIGVERIMK